MVKNILKHILKCNLIVIVLVNICSFIFDNDGEYFGTLVVFPILLLLITPIQFFFMYITYNEDYFKKTKNEKQDTRNN